MLKFKARVNVAHSLIRSGFYRSLFASIVVLCLPLASRSQSTPSCLFENQGDTAQCFSCQAVWRNGSIYSIKDLNYNKGYFIVAGKEGWRVDESDKKCLRNHLTGQKYCNMRC